MPQLHRVTTRYHVKEDRIQMAGELAEGDTVVLWLNQRLLLRLLPHFFTWLEKQHTQDTSNELQNSFAQEVAAKKISVEQAVQLTKNLSEYLVTSIDVTPSTTGIQMQFKSNNTSTSELTFSEHQLRQWLSILYTQWKVAEWPTSVWPNWMMLATKESDDTADPKFIH